MKRQLLPILISVGLSCTGTSQGTAAPSSVGDAASAGQDLNHGTLTSNEAEDQYLFATELFGKKMYQLAVQQYEKFAASFPQHPKAFQARLRIGEAYFRLDQYDKAVAAYEKALAMQPESNFRAEALVGMGLALFNQKNYARAAATLSEAQKLTGNDKTLGPVAANWLGEALFAGEKYAEAMAAYQSVGKWPESAQAPQAMYSIGFCQLRLNQPDRAAETFRKVAAQYGDSPVAAEAALRAGDVLRRDKQYKAAAEQYEFILRKYGTGEFAGDAQSGLAWTRFAQGDFTGARAAFQTVLSKYPSSNTAAEAPLRIGDCYYSEKKFSEAAGSYAEAGKSANPEIAAEATYWLGMSRLELKSYAEATSSFETLAAKYPKSAFAQRGQVRLAESLTQQGKTDAALDAYRKAIALNPGTPAAEIAAYAQGVLLYGAKRVPEASTAFRQFLERYPKSGQAAAARLALAQCQFEGKEFGPAAATLQPLTSPGASKGDTLAAAWFLLGQCQSRLSKPDEAVTSFQASVDAAPQGPYAPRALAAMGSILTARGKTTEAGEVYALLSRKYSDAPQAGDALLRAADSARAGGRHEEAVRLYSQVVAQKAEPGAVAKARLGLAQSLAQTGKPDAAVRTLEELAASKPEPAIAVRARFVAGEVQEKAGQPDEAIRHYEAALALQPGPEVAAACLLRVGALRSQQKQFAPAADALNRLLTKYSKSSLVPEALYELGWALLEQKQTAKARPYFERLINEFGQHELTADAAFRVAEADFAARQYAKAAPRYRLAATAPAGKELADKAWYKLGWCYREMKEHAHAAEAFGKVPTAFPKSDLAPESRLRAGEALVAQEQFKPALTQFMQLIEQLRGKREGAELLPRAQLGAGQCRLKLGDTDAGLAILRQVAVTGNGAIGAEAQAGIGDSFFERGQYKVAREEYLRVTLLFESTPSAPYAQFRLGDTCTKLGDTMAAQGAYRKVIEGWPDSYWAQQARQRLGGRAVAPGTPARKAAPAPAPTGGRTVVPPAPPKRGSQAARPPAVSGAPAGAGERVSALPQPRD
jgi:cellulose synthase operon protein C